MGRPGREADASEAFRAFGLSLRRWRDERRLTQSEVAETLGVQRATLSQWETGRHLPAAEKAVALDELLGAAGELAAGAESARSTDSGPSPPVIRLSLRDAHGRVGRALVARLRHDPTGGPIGWSHDFDPDLPPTPLSSAFAVKTLALIEAPYIDLAALARRLVAGRERGGGWGARRMRARPESSAVVLDALTRIGGERGAVKSRDSDAEPAAGGELDVDVDAELTVIEGMIGDQSSTKPRATSSTYVLATVLEVVARLRPGSKFANDLTAKLLSLQRESGWPEKKAAAASSVRSQLSTAHTARAVIALAVVRDTEPRAGDRTSGTAERDAHRSARRRAADAVELGVDWLRRHAQDHPVRENIYAIDRGGEIGDLEIRHMTPALIARALALADEPDAGRIQRALDTLWSRYDPDLGLWAWPNGDVPPWLQYDAVAATRVAYGCTTTVAVPRA